MSRISGVTFVTLAGILLAAAVLIPSVEVAAEPAQPDWFLHESSPDPFCPESQATTIEFAVAQLSNVVLQVWDEGMTTVVRTLFDGVGLPGYFTVIWDGTDEEGEQVPEGDYPYVMTATDPDSGALLFEDVKTASVCCSASPIDPGTWSRIKDLYRDPDR
jgi:hypothetical protein